MPISRTRLLGAPVDAATLCEAVDALLSNPAPGRYVVVANVHLLYEAAHQPKVQQAFEQAALVVTDGMPLVWLARRQHAQTQRITGIALMDALCARARSAFFLGGEEGVAEQVAAHYQVRHPGLRIAGTLCPPFRPLSEAEHEAMRDTINRAAPDVLFVALGAPKQELWMMQHCPLLTKVALTVGVGAAFHYATGSLRRAPALLQRMGLEWLWRLLQEPRRLLRRYLVTNTWFLWQLFIRVWRP